MDDAYQKQVMALWGIKWFLVLGCLVGPSIAFYFFEQGVYRLITGMSFAFAGFFIDSQIFKRNGWKF